MRIVPGSLALAVTSLGLFGLVGCGEDNEKAAGGEGGVAGVKAAGTVDPTTYGKAGAGDLAPKTEENSATPVGAPAAKP